MSKKVRQKEQEERFTFTYSLSIDTTFSLYHDIVISYKNCNLFNKFMCTCILY